MCRGTLGYAGLAHRILECYLDSGFRRMLAKSASGLRAGTYGTRGEQELPSQALAGAWVLPLQSIRLRSKVGARRKVLPMRSDNFHQLATYGRPEAIGQQDGQHLELLSDDAYSESMLTSSRVETYRTERP